MYYAHQTRSTILPLCAYLIIYKFQWICSCISKGNYIGFDGFTSEYSAMTTTRPHTQSFFFSFCLFRRILFHNMHNLLGRTQYHKKLLNGGTLVLRIYLYLPELTKKKKKCFGSVGTNYTHYNLIVFLLFPCKNQMHLIEVMD